MSQTGKINPLHALIQLLVTLELPCPALVQELLDLGVDPMKTMIAGANVWSNPVERFRWFQAWLQPDLLAQTKLKVPGWTAAMIAQGVHPLSLLFSSQTQEEFDCYQHLTRKYALPGRLKWDPNIVGVFPIAIFGKTQILFEGSGKNLCLPEGLVVQSPLVLRDWQIPEGWPLRFNATDSFGIEQCHGNLGFPAEFSVERSFRANDCTGLSNLPRGSIHLAVIQNCDLVSLAAHDTLCQLALFNCDQLSRLGSFPKLESLALNGCPALNALPCLPQLDTLTIERAIRLPNFHAEGPLERVVLYDLTEFRQIPAHFPPVDWLLVKACPKLHSVRGLKAPLRLLIIDHCPKLLHLPADLHVGRLHLFGTNLKTLPPGLGLVELKAEDCPELKDLGVDPAEIRTLNLLRCPQLSVKQRG